MASAYGKLVAGLAVWLPCTSTTIDDVLKVPHCVQALAHSLIGCVAVSGNYLTQQHNQLEIFS